MAYELREGQGSIFPNKKREKDTQPNARGELRIGGVLYEVAAWTKTDKNGDRWQSLAVKVKEDRPARGGQSRDDADRIPF